MNLNSQIIYTRYTIIHEVYLFCFFYNLVLWPSFPCFSFSSQTLFQYQPFIINHMHWVFPDGGSTKSHSVGYSYHRDDNSMMNISVGWFVLMMILMVLFVFGFCALSVVLISRHCTWTFPARSRRGYHDIATEERVVFSKWSCFFLVFRNNCESNFSPMITCNIPGFPRYKKCHLRK